MQKRGTYQSLIVREQLLRFEIHILRSDLLYNDDQILFKIYNSIRFVFDDIGSLFQKRKLYKEHTDTKQQRLIKEKKQEIQNLIQYKKKLLFLSHSPFMLLVWGIYFFRYVRSIMFPKKQEEQQIYEGKKNIIIFSSCPYGGRRERSRYLAQAISKKKHYRVFYIENRFTQKKKNTPLFLLEKKTERLAVVKLTAARDLEISYQKPSKKELDSIHTSLRAFLASLKKNENLTLKIDHPFWGYIHRPSKSHLLYDLGALPNRYGPHLTKNHKNLQKNAKKTITSHLLPNASDFSHFSSASVKKDTCTVGLCWIHRPVIGCLGVTDEILDYDLLERILVSYPEASLVFEGKLESERLSQLMHTYKTIFPIGTKPYEKLPLYLQTFDLCIVPYKDMQHVPHELYDYLSAGKPIVSTVKPAKKLLNYIYYAKDKDAFIKGMREGLREAGKIRKRQKIALSETWNKRAVQFVHMIDNL